MKKKNGGDASAKGGEDDHEYRRKCWTSSQKILSQRCGWEEYRSWRKRKKTRDCWTVVKQKEKNGHNIGNVMEYARQALEE